MHYYMQFSFDFLLNALQHHHGQVAPCSAAAAAWPCGGLSAAAHGAAAS